MKPSHTEFSSFSLTLQTARKRTRSQRHRDVIEEVNNDDNSRPNISLSCSNPSLPDEVSDNSDNAPFFVSSAPDRHIPQCIWRQSMFSLAAAALLLCSPSLVTYGDARRTPSALFVSPINSQRSLMNPLMSIQRKTPKQSKTTPNLDTTWSKAVRQTSELNESRFGVRKRVKSVLKKAKKRTGIENSSTGFVEQSRRVNGQSSFVQTGPNIVAEAASLGGFDAVVIDEEGSMDVALDYISKGDEEPAMKTATGSNGDKYEDPAILTKLADEVNGSALKNGAKVSPSPSSTNVPSISPTPFRRPEDDFIIRDKSNDKMNNGTSQRPYAEKDAFTGDVSAAFSIPREPLPFKLPSLSAEQSRRVVAGERVEFQDDMGRAGSGFVVWDVKAPASVVWDCLLDFQSYPQTIPTVREVVMYTNTHLKEDYRAEKPVDYEDGTTAICKHGVPSVTRAQFQLSKFRLKIAAVHKYRPHPKGDYMIFTLDPASTNMVLKYAKGIWYTESNPDGKEGYTRVWLLCELKVSRILPQWIVDYAAARAMPRATSWLKPQTEAAAMLWLKDSS